MAEKVSSETAAAILAVTTFQLWQAWNNTAPSLSDLRGAQRGDGTHQRLMDATYQVGGLVVMIGLAFGALSGDWRALGIMAAIFGALTFWSFQVLAADSR